MERVFKIGRLIFVVLALLGIGFYVGHTLTGIKADTDTTAESVIEIKQDLADAQDRIDYLADEVDTVNSTVRSLWTMPFCFSETEDSVMIGCEYYEGGWYRENNGDGFGVTPGQ